MSKLLWNVLKISGGANAPNTPPRVARLSLCIANWRDSTNCFVEKNYSVFPDHQSLRYSSLDFRTWRTQCFNSTVSIYR